MRKVQLICLPFAGASFFGEFAAFIDVLAFKEHVRADRPD